MGAINHKISNPINVIQSLPDRVVGNAQTLKASFDNVGEIVRLKHNDLCDYVDLDMATKAEIQGLILGQIADGTITTAKLDPNALQANVTKLTAGNATIFGVDNVDDVVDIIKLARFYGKYSQMSGGEARTGSVQSGIVNFTTEDNDDFSAIDIPTSTTKITIPSGVTKAKFYWNGKCNGNVNEGSVIRLYKNGAELSILTQATTGNYAVVSTAGCFYSMPIPVTQGDYFEVYATLQGSSSSISAGSVFGMEVIG